MSKGDFIKLDETTELMKISADKYRYNNPLFTKPTAKISDFNADIKLKVGKLNFTSKLLFCSQYVGPLLRHVREG